MFGENLQGKVVLPLSHKDMLAFYFHPSLKDRLVTIFKISLNFHFHLFPLFNVSC